MGRKGRRAATAAKRKALLQKAFQLVPSASPPPLPPPPTSCQPVKEQPVAHKHEDIDEETNLLKKLEVISERLAELNERAQLGIGEINAAYDDDIPMFCRPIGFIKSAYPSKTGTPRQGSLCPDIRAELRIEKTVFTNAKHSLEGLKDFTHVWLIFWFHLNDQTSVKAKVKPPRLDGTAKKGVFATRSPHRPNPVGLSLVRLDQIVGDTLFLTGVDLVDGSPVLDIKPFIEPYDVPIVNPKKEVANPNWVTLADRDCPSLNTIEFSSYALRQLKRFHKRCANGCEHCLRFVDDLALYEAMHELLKSDLRSRYRRMKCRDRIQFLHVDNIKVSVWYDSEGNAHVLDVQPYVLGEKSSEGRKRKPKLISGEEKKTSVGAESKAEPAAVKITAGGEPETGIEPNSAADATEAISEARQSTSFCIFLTTPQQL